ncbi:serine hydrolase domain-containing protein [Paenibacillus eucommiae]|uniref:CubicO group peptidase (Beta-lactamase class C family) n=1 Tax=Paenibacillus eucommiae TaxID=1355755 RepID=A0ABS4IW73_9BACL|nr:serine hydrolase domain-containing protein [Paenibacillus eucommiae]MBP1991091.1 CubicO group peptidase (beta-lactamase class C family) [Paenibacillus eucommiae]
MLTTKKMKHDRTRHAKTGMFTMAAAMKKKLVAGLILLAFLVTGTGSSLFWVQGSVFAAVGETSSQAAEPDAAPADLNDPAAVAAFIDKVMKSNMNTFKIPGAVISIVKDGKLLFTQGYGHSNIEEGSPIDPETSLFRIASTTKLFTWTAVMQLVEQGKIDLDTDINSYLKTVKIPDTYEQPITMRHLLTHTAGFEEGGVGYQITTDPKKLPVSISETLDKHMLARVRPPGEIVSYSNYGAALAGLIVEEVSGLPFDDYIQKHIFDPLDMKYATVQEPVPASLEPYSVLGYASKNDSFVNEPPTFEGGFRPAGSGSVSAIDMAHFMIAHLNKGSYKNKQILNPETAKLMHSTAFQLHKQLPGMALGFYELNMNGQRVISHGGADTLFNTQLYLVPDKQIGIFVSYSGGEGGGAAENLAKAFFDHYFPAPEIQIPPLPSNIAETLQKYAGSYKFTRRNFSDIDKFFSFMVEMKVTISDDQLSIGEGEERMLFALIEPNLFQQVGGPHQLGFRTNASGEITQMGFDFMPDLPLERAKLMDQTKLWFPLLGAAVVLFISVLIGFAIRIRTVNKMDGPQKRAVWLSVATAGWVLLTCILTVTLLMNMDTLERLSSTSTSVNIYLIMPIIFLGLTVALLVSAIMAWKDKYWTVFMRVYYTLVVLAAIALSLFFYHWNLIGWQFG